MAGSNLVFTSDNAFLLHSLINRVEVWNLDAHQLCYKRSGTLIGLSRDSSTFLTCQSHAKFWGNFWHATNDPKFKFNAWNLATGTTLPLDRVDPQMFALHQRVVISGGWEEKRYRLQVHDALSINPTQSFEFSDLVLSSVIAPNDRYLVVLLYWDVGTWDGTFGQCIDLQTGETVYDFKAVDTGPNPISFSIDHNLLVVNGNLYDLETGQHLEHNPKPIPGDIERVSPKNKWLIASTTERAKYIHLVALDGSLSGQVFKEVLARIRTIAFHPEGELIASAVSNNEIHFWSIATGEIIITLRPTEKIMDCR